MIPVTDVIVEIAVIEVIVLLVVIVLTAVLVLFALLTLIVVIVLCVVLVLSVLLVPVLFVVLHRVFLVCGWSFCFFLMIVDLFFSGSSVALSSFEY